LSVLSSSVHDATINISQLASVTLAFLMGYRLDFAGYAVDLYGILIRHFSALLSGFTVQFSTL